MLVIVYSVLLCARACVLGVWVGEEMCVLMCIYMRSCNLTSHKVAWKAILFCFRNNEVQFAGELQPRGCCYRLNVPLGDAKVLYNFRFLLKCIFRIFFVLTG